MLTRLNNQVEETAVIADSLIDSTKEINGLIDRQMSIIESVVSEIENYAVFSDKAFSSAESSKEIAMQTNTIALEGTGSVDSALGAMNEIEDVVSLVKSSVQEMYLKSQSIDDLLKIIKDIAGATNLISLNASIEAARAGEAGRGFAVVAGEVKKLANRSLESVGKINQIVQDIKESIDNTTNLMASTVEKVQDGKKITEETRQVFENISTATQETSAMAEEINNVILQQSETLKGVSGSAKDMSQRFVYLSKAMEGTILNAELTGTSLNKLETISTALKGSYEKERVIKLPGQEKLTLNMCEPYHLEEKDPTKSIDVVGNRVILNTHAALITIDSEGNAAPNVARYWKLHEDQLTWDFQLRKGIRFHNGDELTAEDVVFSFERLLSKELNSPLVWMLLDIKGAEEYNKGLVPTISGLKATGPHTVQIKLKIPYIAFLLNLGQQCCAIINKNDWQKNKTITGCGPYMLKSMNAKEINLEAFSDYFLGEPYIPRINIIIDNKNLSAKFLSKKYDFIRLEEAQTYHEVKDKTSNTLLIDLLGIYYLGLNLRSSNPLVQSKTARQALNYAIDKEKIVKEVLLDFGSIASSPVPASMFAEKYKLEPYPYNPQKAREMLSATGIKNMQLNFFSRDDGQDGPFSMTIPYIEKNLNDVGVQVITTRTPCTEFLKNKDHLKSDLYFSRWLADTTDMDNFLHSQFHPESSINFSAFNNESFNRLLSEAKQMMNPYKRNELYLRVARLLHEEAPWIFLFHPKQGLTHHDYLSGMNINPLAIIKYDELYFNSE